LTKKRKCGVKNIMVFSLYFIHISHLGGRDGRKKLFFCVLSPFYSLGRRESSGFPHIFISLESAHILISLPIFYWYK
jgi:hypothetical protein